MALTPGSCIEGLSKVDRLLTLEENQGKLIRKLADEVEALKDRLTKLEAQVQAREEIMVAKAEAAVGLYVNQQIGGLSREIGILQERTRGLRLPPPES
jgi:predicted nuclease with TOPRIM domain